jgi:hypothetical protein
MKILTTLKALTLSIMAATALNVSAECNDWKKAVTTEAATKDVNEQYFIKDEVRGKCRTGV